jgi:hypothetical protein
MLLPSCSRLMTHFKVPYANTTNYYEGETGNYFFINEKYYPTQQLLTPPGKKPALNETALRQVQYGFSSTKDIICPPAVQTTWPVWRKIRPLRKKYGPLLFLTLEGFWAEEKKSLLIKNYQCNLLQDVVNFVLILTWHGGQQ